MWDTLCQRPVSRCQILFSSFQVMNQILIQLTFSILFIAVGINSDRHWQYTIAIPPHYEVCAFGFENLDQHSKYHLPTERVSN